KAPVVKTHGSTGPEAVRNTISQIKTMLEEHLVEELQVFFEDPKA
ncbi:MAG: phosphate acyltransferase, partial [Vagococcus sp.]